MLLCDHSVYCTGTYVVCFVLFALHCILCIFVSPGCLGEEGANKEEMIMTIAIITFLEDRRPEINQVQHCDTITRKDTKTASVWDKK